MSNRKIKDYYIEEGDDPDMLAQSVQEVLGESGNEYEPFGNPIIFTNTRGKSVICQAMVSYE